MPKIPKGIAHMIQTRALFTPLASSSGRAPDGASATAEKLDAIPVKTSDTQTKETSRQPAPAQSAQAVPRVFFGGSIVEGV